MTNKAKGNLVVLIGIFTIAFIAFAALSTAAAVADDDSISVFLGDGESDFAWCSMPVLKVKAQVQPATTSRALVTFDDFQTPAQVETMLSQLSDQIEINNVFLAKPGVAGRITLTDTNWHYAENKLAKMISDAYIQDGCRIFAISLTALPKDLLSLVDTTGVASVQPHEMLLLEIYAQKHGKTVFYIEMPGKPDGSD